MTTAAGVLTIAQSFADWLYSQSSDLTQFSAQRTAYNDSKTNNLEEGNDAAKLQACFDFIFAFSPYPYSDQKIKNTTLLKEFRGKFFELIDSMNQFTPVDNNQQSPLEAKIAPYAEKIHDYGKKMRSYFTQVIFGVFAGVSAISAWNFLSPNKDNSSDEESSDNISLADASLFVFYLVSSTATYLLQIYKAEEINELLSWIYEKMPQSARTIADAIANPEGDKFIPSYPFFVSTSFSITTFASVSTLNIMNGNNPLNWLALLYPLAGSIAGRGVGFGVDKMRLGVSKLCSFSKPQGSAQEQQSLLPSTPVLTGSINNDDSASQSNCAWLMKKICGK